MDGGQEELQQGGQNYGNGFAAGGYHCEFCSKEFPDRLALVDHIHSKHPNLTKRIQAFKEALGLNDSDEPDTKHIKLDYQEAHKKETDELCNNQTEQQLKDQVEVAQENAPPSSPSQVAITHEEEEEEEDNNLVIEDPAEDLSQRETELEAEEPLEVEAPLEVDEDDVRH